MAIGSGALSKSSGDLTVSDVAREPRGTTRQWVPLLLALAILWVGCAAVGWMSLRQNGMLVYALDDAYIHMAVAKNTAEHGVWGITRFGFSSAVSSLLWPLLIAGIYVVIGPQTWVPLALNVVFASIFLVVSHAVLRTRRVSDSLAAVALIAMVAASPLILLVYTGMEHVLHALVFVLFLWLGSHTLSSSRPVTGSDAGALMVAAALLPMVRYEGLFAVAVLGAALVAQQRWKLLAGIAAASALPLAVYGYVSVRQGWEWLPNSLLLKAGVELNGLRALLSFARGGFERMSDAPEITVLLILVLALLANRRIQDRISSQERAAAWLYLGSVVLHLWFSRIGWFYRYEAYLIAAGLVVAVPLLHAAWPGRFRWSRESLLSSSTLALVAISVFAVKPFLVRLVVANYRVPQAMNDRYLEHILPAVMVRRSFNDAVVALNDIGTTSFLSDARVLDVYGLGSIEPLHFRRSTDGYGPDDLERWARKEGAELAILQTDWDEVAPRIPSSWIQVAEWKIPRNVVFPDRTVGFFALDREGVEPLVAALRDFAPSVPKSVQQKILAIDLDSPVLHP